MTTKDTQEDAQKAFRRWAKASQSASKLRAALEVAETEPGIPVEVEAFDQNQWLLNLPNGVLDLRSGTLEPHRRDFYMTQLARTIYDPKAVCPRFLEFLDRNSGGRSELVRFKQRVYGSALTGSIRDQKVYILHGSGANGKSVELSVIRQLLGDYACQTASETLVKRNPGTASNDLARLRGKRMAVANETEAGDKLAAALLKQMSGGEPITARKLYQEFMEIQPTWKVFLGTNHLPMIDGSDPALLRRLVLIPYDDVVPEHERDPDLTEKLLAEAPGILSWMLEGCLEWQETGLSEPDCVRQSVEAYRGDSDPVGTWVDECCELGDFQTPAGELWKSFWSWSLLNGHDGVSQTRFGIILGQKGFQKVKSGKVHRAGLRPRSVRHH